MGALVLSCVVLLWICSVGLTALPQVKQDMKRGRFFGGREVWDDMEFMWEGGGGGSLHAHVLWDG
jgi:hypothetical protein